MAPLTADAAARLALGDAERALALALADGPALRDDAERYARAALHGDLAERPHVALLDLPRARGDAAKAAVAERIAADAELLPDREARRAQREGETAKRATSAAPTPRLDHGLQLAGLWLRDVACVKDGAPELVHHVDRAARCAPTRRADARPTGCATPSGWSRRRARLQILNPTEELALEALASKLERTLRA